MVEDVECRGVELKIYMFAEFHILEHGDIGDVADRVLLNVSRHVAERCPEYALRCSTVGDVANVVRGDLHSGNRIVVGVEQPGVAAIQSIQAN